MLFKKRNERLERLENTVKELSHKVYILETDNNHLKDENKVLKDDIERLKHKQQEEDNVTTVSQIVGEWLFGKEETDAG